MRRVPGESGAEVLCFQRIDGADLFSALVIARIKGVRCPWEILSIDLSPDSLRFGERSVIAPDGRYQ
jgi:hypothetical protein